MPRILAATIVTCCALASWHADVPAQCTAPASPKALAAHRVGATRLDVSDVAIAAETLWVATRGSGVFGVTGSERTWLDVGKGLPSAMATQLDARGDALLVGTAQGALAVDAATRTYRCAAAGEVEILRSTPTGVLAQIRPPDGAPQAVRIDVVNADSSPFTHWPAGAAMATAWDRRSGCLDVAGMQRSDGERTLWLASHCEQPTHHVLHERVAPDVVGVSALARDPVTADPVLAVARQKGSDPFDRSYHLLVSDAQGRLREHCSRVSVRRPIVGIVSQPASRSLVIAVHGHGLKRLACHGAAAHPLAGDHRLRWVTSLTSGPRGELLVGTESGAYAIDAASNRIVAKLESPPDAMPVDTSPTDVSADGRHMLASSAREGIVELRRTGDRWVTHRRWRVPHAIPDGPYGPAVYGSLGRIYALNHRLGPLRITDKRVEWLVLSAQGATPFREPARWSSMPPAAAPRVWTHFGSDGAGGIWVGLQALRGTQPETLLHLRADGSSDSAPVRDARLRPAGKVLAMAADKAWAPTRMGLVEFSDAAPARRLSMNRVQALFRNHRTGTIAAVGATIETLRDGRLHPVLFGIPGNPSIGHPVDVVVDNEGRWTILYVSGAIVLLDAHGEFVDVLGTEGGFPTTGTRLLHVPQTDEIFLGTADSGLFLLQRQRSP